MTPIYAIRHAEYQRSEVQYARHSGGHQLVAHRLRGAGRHRDHADRDAVLCYYPLKLANVPDQHAAEFPADQGRVGVEYRLDAEPPGQEPAVVGKGPAEVTGADDHHGPALSQSQRPRHLVHQVLDVVTDPSDAVRTEVTQVLAELGGVDARHPRELVARDGAHPALTERVERTQVDREPGHRRLRDTARAAPGDAIGRLGFRIGELGGTGHATLPGAVRRCCGARRGPGRVGDGTRLTPRPIYHTSFVNKCTKSPPGR